MKDISSNPNVHRKFMCDITNKRLLDLMQEVNLESALFTINPKYPDRGVFTNNPNIGLFLFN